MNDRKGGLYENSEAIFDDRSEEHTSELQSPCNLVCRLLLEKYRVLDRSETARHRTRARPRGARDGALPSARDGALTAGAGDRVADGRDRALRGQVAGAVPSS